MLHFITREVSKLFCKEFVNILRFYLFIYLRERERTSSGEGQRERERSRLPVNILGFVGHRSLLPHLNSAVVMNQYVEESVVVSNKIVFTKIADGGFIVDCQ